MRGTPVLAAFVGVLSGCAQDPEPAFVCTAEASLELYDKRIAPLLSEAGSSSCGACHLSGIDLSIWRKDTPCATMACLQSSGLVDLEDPEHSVVMRWIERADPASGLVSEEALQEERDGFLEWIRFTAHCGDAVCEPIEDPCGNVPLEEECPVPPHPDESTPIDANDPGGCSDLALETLFRDKVYAWRGRCFPCHFSSQEIPEAPDWIEPGPCAQANLATMRNVEASAMIDWEDPANSPLMRKPLAEAAGGLPHGGHDKFETEDDLAYREMAYWVQRFVDCREAP